MFTAVMKVVTNYGDEFEVLETTRHGDPKRVQHAIPRFRGSFVEKEMNLSLALRNLRVELRQVLPRWLQRRIPPPRIFWRTL